MAIILSLCLMITLSGCGSHGNLGFKCMSTCWLDISKRYLLCVSHQIVFTLFQDHLTLQLSCGMLILVEEFVPSEVQQLYLVLPFLIMVLKLCLVLWTTLSVFGM